MPLPSTDRPPGAAGLSRRERQVLEAYAVYWSWKLVGYVLGISARTAEWHGQNACRKLGTDRIGQAIIAVKGQRTPVDLRG